ncbi:MAG: hypothetical protein NTX64_00220, partial [Elusimicrobia bacterium]|nr:hypothetical protein [Elusimicrobiota bacterium]
VSAGIAGINGLSPVNAQRYAADNNGRVYQINPVAATLTTGGLPAVDGTTAISSITAYGLKLFNSTNSQTCGGNWPCGATNQVIFTSFDRAGLAQRLGPFAILVDTVTPTGLAVSTPALPLNGSFVNIQLPTTYGGVSTNFAWIGPSTATIVSLPLGTSFYLQVSNNDPAFGNIVISISTPIAPAVFNSLVTSTGVPTTVGGYVSTFTLTNATTYYWRVAVINGSLGTVGPWSSTSSFVTAFVPPIQAAIFTSVSSTGGAMGETQLNNLLSGVTAQISVQDMNAGLAVSTSVLAYFGDGHDGPSPTGAFGVLYSTTAGKSWIDYSTVTTVNNGNPVGTRVYAMTVFGGKLYAASDSGYVYQSADGSVWQMTNFGQPAGQGSVHPLRTMVAFNSRLFAGTANGRVLSSADGWNWIGSSVTQIGINLPAMAVFNNRLYAGEAGVAGAGRVYVSTDGNTWSCPQCTLPTFNYGMGGPVQSLIAFNGRLFAGDTNGRISVSVDGSTWASTNGGALVAPAGQTIWTFAAYNNKLYAGANNGIVYVSTDGGNYWNGTNGNSTTGWAINQQDIQPIQALAAFNGKLYAGDMHGRVYVSTEGSAWLLANSSYTMGTNQTAPSGINALAPFNGKLYAGDIGNGDVYQITPVAAALGGGDGTNAPQVLSATSLNLAPSANTVVCNNLNPCVATNQIMFTASDRGGNVYRAGPYAIQVDATTSLAISTPSLPANGAYVSMPPNFDWIGPSTTTLAQLPTGTSYFIQVSKNDTGFAQTNVVVSITTPAVVTSTMLPVAAGAYLSTFTGANLPTGNTYYWRVQIVNGAYGSTSTWSSLFSFVTDLAAPAQASAFYSISSTAGVMGETQVSNVLVGVTASVGVQDATSGLVVSTNVVAFAGDGHNNPGVTAGFGVIYSTNAGQTWIDASTITSLNSGNFIVAGATQLRGMAVFNNNLYVADGVSGRVYSSPDGITWSATNSNTPVGAGGAGGPIRALAVFNGKLYAADNNSTSKVYWTADGASWFPSNNNAAVGSNAGIASLAVYNGRLYAGDASVPPVGGRVYISTDGNSWTPTIAFAAGSIQSLAVFNNKFLAGDSTGKVYFSADGSSVSWSATNGGGALSGVSASGIGNLAVFNNRLVAADAGNGKIYVSTDGSAWNTGTVAGAGPNTAIQSLTAFNGKLYAGDANGRLWVSTEASTWLVTNGSYPIATTALYGLAAFNGKLYAADNAGYMFQVTPVGATLNAATDGITTAQTFTASGMVLTNSTNTKTCGGSWPCGATNQVIFTLHDRAGAAQRLGPFAIQVDGTTALAISTPTFPAQGQYVTMVPNFNWTGPSTTTIGGLPAGSSYYLQVSKNDLNFTAGNIVIAITTPVVTGGSVQVSTVLPTGLGAYVSTYTGANLPSGTTYYWRVATINGASGLQGLWSSSFSFVTDYAPPVQSGLFTSAASTGGVLGETQINGLAVGVTAQVNLSAAVSGLVVSTAALALAGDGHDNPGVTSGFGVIYSTNAGQTWVDASLISNMAGGGQIVSAATNLRGFAVFNGRLYVADGTNGK